jgi:hypothetical protein
VNHPNPQLDIVRWDGPPPDAMNSNNAFTVIAEADGVTCKNGDTLSASNINGNIRVFIDRHDGNDAKFIVGAFDATYSHGSPGIGFNAQERSEYNQAAITSFSATDAPRLVGAQRFASLSHPRFKPG